jgi:hypothetical protein
MADCFGRYFPSLSRSTRLPSSNEPAKKESNFLEEKTVLLSTAIFLPGVSSLIE